MDKGELLIYQNSEGSVKIDVQLFDETVWLSQAQMGALFQKSKSTISEHIRNIFLEGELVEHSVVRKFRTTATDGKNYETQYYNLDVIISVGYRVKSVQGTQFRIWATQRLKEFIIKGFTLNDGRLGVSVGLEPSAQWKRITGPCWFNFTPNGFGKIGRRTGDFPGYSKAKRKRSQLERN
jgi:hypothetical protein